MLRSQGSTHYLVLRLGRPRVEVGGRSAGGLKAHCRRELRRLLTLALGRPVEFWFTLEGHSLSQGRLKITDHLNIVMVIHEHETRKVRDVLIDFSAYHYRQRALTVDGVWNGFWLSFYTTKEYVDIQARLGVNQFAITQELSRRAKALYEADLHDIRAAQALRGAQLAA